MSHQSERLTADEIATRILEDHALSQAGSLLQSIERRDIQVWWCRSCEGLHQSPDDALSNQLLRGIKANYSGFVALP